MSVAMVAEAAPTFALACVHTDALDPRTVRLSDYAGQWLALIFYPHDFSFVCPTELTAFSARYADFSQRGCELLGISVDSISFHQEWLTKEPANGGLGPLQFPLASDPDGTVARAYGVWSKEKKVSHRGLFIMDPRGILQYSVVHNLSVGRSPDEVLRVLDALQSGGLCPASWTAADGTIDPERLLRQGTILGHYHIRRKLGSGTFGTVFAAWDLQLERMVAIKVLKRRIFESRDAVLAESRAAARLNHPHVCIVYAVEEEDGLPLIAMEYVEGQPLSQLIRDGLPRESAWQLAAQIASGLAAAHELGVVHGDLKPANIMVTRHGIAKILDFGLARSQRGASANQFSESQRPLSEGRPDMLPDVDDPEATVQLPSSKSDQRSGIQGSLAYMSPEQARGLPATPASDVFSFGLTLIEMLTGSPAHVEALPLKLLARLQMEDLAAELCRNVDESYQDLLLPMLTQAPGTRPTMSDVVRRLSTQ
jgi:eukaryotic-like serine/threonine-protein kinase